MLQPETSPAEEPALGGKYSINPEEQTFTTGDVAKLALCSLQTIIRVVDSGEMGRRVPGSTFRRIDYPELMRFLQSNGIPIDSSLEPEEIVLVPAGTEEEFSKNAQVVHNTFDAGMYCAAYPNAPLSVREGKYGHGDNKLTHEEVRENVKAAKRRYREEQESTSGEKRDTSTAEGTQ